MARQQIIAVKNECLFALAASILPVIVTLLWLAHNLQLPGNDASNYLMTAIDNYHRYTQQGFLHGLASLYLQRGWRPIFFPVLAAPFLWLSHGNLFVAYAAVGLAGIIATAIYFYLYFRLVLNRAAALIAANLIGLLPLVQTQFVMFYAEGALIPCLLGAIYHLIRSDYLRNAKQAWLFAILLALAVMIRPIEAVTQFLFIFLLFLYSGWRGGYIAAKQLFLLSVVSLFALTVFFAACIKPYVTLQLIQVMDGGQLDAKLAKTIYYGFFGSAILTAIGLLSVGYKNVKSVILLPLDNKSNQTVVVPAIATALSIILIWFLPFASGTYQWIFRTSLGDVAQSTGSLTGATFSWDVFHIYMNQEGTLAVIASVGVAIFALMCLARENRRAILCSAPFIYLLCVIPFPFWETFYTVQIVTRKLSFAYPALLSAMLMLGLQQGRYWRLRMSVIGIVLVVQFSLMLALIFVDRYPSPTPIIQTLVGYFMPQPVSRQPNPHDVVKTFLALKAKEKNLHNIGLEVDPGTPDARHFVEAEPIDPFLLGTILDADVAAYAVSYPYFGEDDERNLQTLKQRYDGLFISDSKENMIVSPQASHAYQQKYVTEKSPSLRVFYQLLQSYSDDKLAMLGWDVDACVTIQSDHHGDYVGCLLLPHKEKH